MNCNLSQTLNRVVNSYTEDALSISLEKNGSHELLCLVLSNHLNCISRKLKLLAETAGRNSIISLDFYTFIPLLSSQLESAHLRKMPRVCTSFYSNNEYKRCAPPPEHAYRFSKTKGLRLDDLFSVRKRKTHQTQQIEASLILVINQKCFDYDA